VYERSAQFYDLIYSASRFKPVAEWAGEVDAIIRERNPSARTLLDVACGTGHHLSYLRDHYSVEGVDISEEMLRLARARLPDVPLHHADMRTLDLGRTFDSVICLFSSIGYAHGPDELAATVDGFGRHLNGGGVIVVEGWVRPDAFNDRFRGEPEVVMSDEVDIVRLSRSERRGRYTRAEMHHLVRTDQGIEHFAESHVMYMATTEEYVAAVEAAGLRAEVLPDYMPDRDRVVGVKS
jgi:SAM-dependent methyltransferase